QLKRRAPKRPNSVTSSARLSMCEGLIPTFGARQRASKYPPNMPSNKNAEYEPMRGSDSSTLCTCLLCFRFTFASVGTRHELPNPGGLRFALAFIGSRRETRRENPQSYERPGCQFDQS